MRYAIISDIHSNHAALEASLQLARKEGFDKLLVLGDLVGYNADPKAVLDLLEEYPDRIVIRGNHDKVVSGVETGNGFSKDALLTARWTASQLSKKQLAYLAALPEGPIKINQELQIAHGSPQDEDMYIFDPIQAETVLKDLDPAICFFGHTHIPTVIGADSSGLLTHFFQNHGREVYPIASGTKYMINPGSIGQPRDGIPMSSFLIWDDEAREIIHFRCSYDIIATQERMAKADIPSFLINRLVQGV